MPSFSVIVELYLNLKSLPLLPRRSRRKLQLQSTTNMAFLFIFIVLLLFDFSAAISNQGTKGSDLRTYIVHVREPETMYSANSLDRQSWYRSFLPTKDALTGSEDGGFDRMVYSYQNVLSGFAALLTEDEVKAMEKKDGFISAHPDSLLPLHTTHTPTFLGLKPDVGVWKETNFGKGVIVGVMDTGAAPNHPSFRDEGMPPPPSKWKGRCEFSSCNKKIIGARAFVSGAEAILGRRLLPSTPEDQQGHGTHTASTAAGAFLKGANQLGNANGTAVGMAPLAHLAIYKVCVPGGCAQSDLTAGLESAIEDGVDVLSISLSGRPPRYFYDDVVDIGTFRAMQKGIFISCSAGNKGPYDRSVSNAAPWYLTVGASNIDRTIRATVMLGNGELFNGQSIFQPKDFKSNDQLPIIFPGASGDAKVAQCTNGSLDGIDVQGKMVLCEGGGSNSRVNKGQVVAKAGGAAMILMNEEYDGFSINAEAHVLPASHVSFLDGSKIKAYINSTSSPTATIVFKGTLFGSSPSPMVASFSSRGPSVPSPGILKPDIIGPGVDILAAWPFHVGSSPPISESSFNIISGTSMSTPHLSGIAAMIKSAHPDWSPAAIKSAIMTTSDLVDHQGEQIVDEKHTPANLFATGSGHVNPSRANDPGLVYDVTPDAYISYLCGLGYADDKVGVIVGQKITCSTLTSVKEGELNYPSFSVMLGPAQIFNRTVTNVGAAESAYSLTITKPQGVEVSVEPQLLSFSKVNERLTYTVTFSRLNSGGSTRFAEGSLKWVSSSPPNKYVVRSPISVSFRTT